MKGMGCSRLPKKKKTRINVTDYQNTTVLVALVTDMGNKKLKV